MIKHIVMWKLKDSAEGNNKLQNALLVKSKLEALKDEIPEIKSIEVGLNVIDSANAFDVVLYSEFESMNDMDAYKIHPAHIRVGEFVGKVKYDTAVVDYEI